ncbi:MAG TPA: thioredoxin [Dehalococcoidia bacterium]|nr:thioredoxin [Dehalococcoidia bacterium]
MSAGAAVLEVADVSFATEVLDRSRSLPVVVDFWAPWCGPCRVLGPTLESVAAEHAGEVVLAKLNTDENQQTAMQFSIQSIPAVKAFRNGSVVGEFLGAIPEDQVRAFFERLVPSDAERAVKQAETLLDKDPEAAEIAFRESLAKGSTPDAVVGLASILLARGEIDEASQLLERAPADRRAKAMMHRLFLDAFAANHADEDIEGEAAANPRDPRARYRWGVMLAANEQYASALEELIESVRLDRKFADGAARKATLAVFDILGLDSPLTRQYQKSLSNVLF